MNIPIPVGDIKNIVSVKRPRLFKRPYSVRIKTPDSKLTLYFRTEKEQEKVMSLIVDLIEKENSTKQENN